MVRFLQRAIPFEKARAVLFDVIIEEAFGCHSFIVAFRNLVIIGQPHLNRLMSEKFVQIMMAQVFPDGFCGSRGWVVDFFCDQEKSEEQAYNCNVNLARKNNSQI